MTTTTKPSYALIAIDEAAREATERGFGLGEPGRGRVYLRRDLGINAFGVNAFHQAASGGKLVGEHTEDGEGASGHEELYLVVNGSCTFTIDGETVDAPQGTALFVPPAAKRSAVANEDGTTVVVVGSPVGEPFEVGAGEAMGDFFLHYRNKDYATALADCRAALETHPDAPVVHYNVACMEALLGNTDAALASLGESLALSDRFKKNAAEDDDFAALRDDPRFQALIA
jgi:tetratricopeptide (TPR) repeat protein